MQVIRLQEVVLSQFRGVFSGSIPLTVAQRRETTNKVALQHYISTLSLHVGSFGIPYALRTVFIWPKS